MKKKLLLMVFLFFLSIGGLQAFSSEAKSTQYKEGGFSYRVSKKEAVITGIDMTSEVWKGKTEITVPGSIGGFTVVALDDDCFLSQRKITKITLPGTLKRVGNSAFAKCEKLLAISLPAGITKIPDGAFYECEKLNSVQLGNKVTKIGENAFYNCISLKRLSLPGTLQEIDRNAFGNCYKLGELKLGKRVHKIGERAFYKNYAMKSITIPAKVAKVGESAFEKCTDLVKVKFSSKNTKLNEKAFRKCESLKTISLPKNLKEVPAYAFDGCKSLTKVTIPKKVGIMKKNAFSNCTKLKTVKLNKKIYALGDRVFADSGLTSLTLNSNLQFIGNGAFQGTKVKKLALKGKVTYIGNRVFADCRKLKVISIPASVKGINTGAFNNCTSLRAINVASGNKKYASAGGVLYNKDKTLLIQYPLHKGSSSFHVPGSVTKIRKNAFSGNDYLQSVTLSAATIEDYAFYGMSRLRSVTLRSGVKAIGYNAFYMSNGIRTLVLPDSVEKIGGYAFEGLKVSRIHIPSRLRQLGTGAFRDCNNLKEFTGSGSSSYTVKEGVLYNKRMTDLIQYPAKKTAKTFTVPDSVKTVRAWAFNRQAYLTKLFFGKNLRSLGYNAIYDAKKLKSIVFETKKLGYYSSSGVKECDNLAVIVGPNYYAMRRIADRANATLITL